MFSTKFGIEIEFTGITRHRAATAVQEVVGGRVTYVGGVYGTYRITAPDGRQWKFMYDRSIKTQKRKDGKIVNAKDKSYSVELVSPILTYYNDISLLQRIVRVLRKAGGLTNATCGIHIHLDGEPHTARTVWNFINLVASRNDLFYKALKIPAERRSYCKKIDSFLVHVLNQMKPKTLREIEAIWYLGYSEEVTNHYHDSRYHFINLHSFFHGNRTIELRGFNSELHAGKVRAYIVFSLAIDHQALTQCFARYQRVQTDNEKFAMRVYLVRIGLSGDEFKNCRKHLYEHLSGNAAWRYGSRENCRRRRETCLCTT